MKTLLEQLKSIFSDTNQDPAVLMEQRAGVLELIALYDAKHELNRTQSKYTLTAYREDGVSSCRGCITGRSGSDFQLIESDDEETFIAEWANLIHFNRTSDREYCEYEFTLFYDGMVQQSGDDDYNRLHESASILADEYNRKKQEDERIRAVENAKKAEQDKIAQEKKKLSELLEKYGNPNN